MFSTSDVRKRYLDYFKKHDHSQIPSSSVVPHDDPTLLFINAGMNQFKDVFLGKTTRDYTRATTSQKCIRVGGKHNDLENVGHTRRHLTFFEMLGNFSFGDYFKEKAIHYAWEVATGVFSFDPEKIWVSVFKDDDEAFELWKKHMPEARIVRMDEKSNFWAMGDTGPCGPCSELLYDRGSSYNPQATNPLNDDSGERFLEFWNLVFMQYNKSPDGTLITLPKPSIDTGAGLERVMSLIHNKETVFETDIFLDLISSIENLSKVTYNPNDSKAPAFRVIADHLRCLAFAISDGAQPSNVERGYVLRKVLRRAVRYGKMLGFEKPFLSQVLPKLVSVMGPDYKELVVAKDKIAEILTLEEESFFRTLRRGGNILNQIIQTSQEGAKEISGADAFKLKDTYGLPIEEVELIAKDNGLQVDMKGFTLLEKEAKQKSKQAQKVIQQEVKENAFLDFVHTHGETAFLREPTTSGKVLGIICDGNFVDSIEEGQEAQVILSKTTFYAEMGGQVGDTGELTNDTSAFSVDNTLSPYKGVISHHGTLTMGHLKIGDSLDTHFDKSRRQKIENNHTATHILHWALHRVLGEHVKQAGSVVEPARLRFDFNHHKALTEDEIVAIEQMVNEKIRKNLPVKAYELAYDEAQKRHDIIQFFGEKYGKTVRVIDADFSKELCGGTHTQNTGNIGYFRIAKESSIASGVRRIDAVTGIDAEDFANEHKNTLHHIAELLKTPAAKITERIEKLGHEVKELEAQVKQMQKERIGAIAGALPFKKNTDGVHYCVQSVSVAPADLKNLMDALSEICPEGALAIACQEPNKVHLSVRVPQGLVTRGFKANELLKPALTILEGSGGGKAEHAQGAGKAVNNIKQALDQIEQAFA
ncbi:MAG: alanine--tRNA ligase [Chlamydiales bacterium]|nr:alanine--tRNA ligase [Chlamydiales bacterium]